MDEKTKELLEGVYPYFKILENVNIHLRELISKNIDNKPYDNTELFYYIATDITRLLPIKGYAWENGKKYCLPSLDRRSGILLLSNKIDYLESEYKKFIENKKCRQALGYILTIRNKYVHQPHNLAFCFSVGGKTSCSMGIYFKDKLQSISTIWLTNIVRDLNRIFEKIRQQCLSATENCESKYKDYPCYKFIQDTSFEEFNRSYDIMPWDYIEIEIKENGDGDMGKILDRAINFATGAHAGQFRKSTSIPYILHPLEAATIVGTMTTDEEIIAGAVLHDVVEDTDTNIGEAEWVQNDPTYGQCAITAMLVYDMFGGTIHRIRVDGGGTHYFNKINGNYIDLTIEQFDLYNIPVSYEPNEEIDRKYCGKNADTQKRFELLIRRIAEYLK